MPSPSPPPDFPVLFHWPTTTASFAPFVTVTVAVAHHLCPYHWRCCCHCLPATSFTTVDAVEFTSIPINAVDTFTAEDATVDH